MAEPKPQIVYEDFVVLANDQESDESSCCLIAVDRRTGKTRWKLPRRRGDTAYATPCVYEPANRAAELIFCGQAYGMTSVDPCTGTLNWELNGLFDRMVVASPVVASGLVIGTCGAVNGGNFLAAVRMTAKGGRTVPEVAYKVRLSASYVPTPIVKGDLIFMWNDNGIVTCLRAATGEQVWRERIDGRGQYFGSPVCVNDRLYCISVDGDVVVLAASAKFQLLARNPLGEKSYATPAVADGRMYLRTYSHLISIGGGR